MTFDSTKTHNKMRYLRAPKYNKLRKSRYINFKHSMTFPRRSLTGTYSDATPISTLHYNPHHYHFPPAPPPPLPSPPGSATHRSLVFAQLGLQRLAAVPHTEHAHSGVGGARRQPGAVKVNLRIVLWMVGPQVSEMRVTYRYNVMGNIIYETKVRQNMQTATVERSNIE